VVLRYQLYAGGGKKLETLFDVIGFKGESFFDPVFMHGDEADAVHQAGATASQVKPELVGLQANKFFSKNL